MIYVDGSSVALVLITLLILGLYNGFRTKAIQNKQLKELETKIKNGSTRIDMSK